MQTPWLDSLCLSEIVEILTRLQIARNAGHELEKDAIALVVLIVA
jgi:hypothetical protein